MKKVEKKVVESVVDNLSLSTNTTWTTGEVEVWAKWARRMRDTIHNSNRTLRGLLETEDEERISNEDMFEILSWLDEHGYLTESAGVIYKHMKESINDEL